MFIHLFNIFFGYMFFLTISILIHYKLFIVLLNLFIIFIPAIVCKFLCILFFVFFVYTTGLPVVLFRVFLVYLGRLISYNFIILLFFLLISIVIIIIIFYFIFNILKIFIFGWGSFDPTTGLYKYWSPLLLLCLLALITVLPFLGAVFIHLGYTVFSVFLFAITLVLVLKIIFLTNFSEVLLIYMCRDLLGPSIFLILIIAIGFIRLVIRIRLSRRRML